MSNFYKNTIAALVITLLNVQVVMAQNKPWTKIVYIIGSDLESKSNAGTNDIAEMTSAGNTDQVNVVLLTGGANKDNWRTPKAYLIDNGAKISLNYTPVNNEMSSPENVTAFINWALKNIRETRSPWYFGIMAVISEDMEMMKYPKKISHFHKLSKLWQLLIISNQIKSLSYWDLMRALWQI